MSKRRIEVVKYDASWPTHFAAEAAELRHVFDGEILAVHHVGSTAVPGLAAKPTIDILVVVRPECSIPNYYGPMRELGYESRGECLDAVIPGTPGRLYFPKIVESQHVVHVHVCAEGHPQIVQLLAFRDYLRRHPNDAAKYGTHKAQLAQRIGHDNIAYMRGKEAMVRELLDKALL